MPRGMMTTYGAGGNQIASVKGTRVIEPPVLEEGVTLINVLEAEYGAKQGIMRSLNALRTYMAKLEQARQDAGVLSAASGTANPVSSIGGSEMSSKETTELQKIFDRYVSALRKGVPLTLDGLNQPLS